MTRTLTTTEKLYLRLAEGGMTIAVAIFACTLAPVGTFAVGMGWCAVLLEIQRWENAQ